MTSETPDDVKNLWQGQPVESPQISLTDLHPKARKFEKRVRWRNRREYAGVAIVIASFGYYIGEFPTPVVRIGCGLVIAGALFVVYALHKRGSARPVPAEMAYRTCLDFHRSELQRQRDLLRTVWSWYLLPFVPGLAVFLTGLAVEQMGGRWRPVIVFALVCAVLFTALERLNRWAARNIQRQIDALSTLEKES